MFQVMKIRKNIQSMFQKNVVKIIIDRWRRKKALCVLIKDFNTFMYGYILNRGRKHFCHYHLQAFSKEGIFKVIKITLKLMVNKGLKYLRKVNILNLQIMKGK